MDNNKQGSNTPFDFSDLADFQFGPNWARKSDNAKAGTNVINKKYNNDDSRPSAKNRDRRDQRDNRERRNTGFKRDDRKERNDSRERRPQRGRERSTWQERPKRELPQPTEGLHVELRPSNLILEVLTKKIHEQKRALPLLELAKLVMSAPERYDMVYMKGENGPSMIHSIKGDNACWLTEAEALTYIWSAKWFPEYYAEVETEVEAPKGSFNAVAVCTMGGELIGPANWHGYQMALIKLHKSKYANMNIEAFRNKIEMKKEEETIAQWMSQASKKTSWKPTREGGDDINLEDSRAVETDFLAHHFKECYNTVDKVFINCATERKLLSPGLAAHMNILSDKSRRFPQMVIPNLCHGLARHHMPIYKWQGNHFTGPSRVRSIPADMVLADRMRAIIDWAKANSGKKLDEMMTEISGVSAGEDDASKAAANEAHMPFITDMIWLLEQGFLVVTTDNSVWYPKGEAAPAAPKLNKPKRNKSDKPSKGKKTAPTPQQGKAPAAPTALETVTEEPTAPQTTSAGDGAQEA